MKPSPLELLLSLAASASMLLAVFHQPLGLSDVWEWGALILVFVFLIPLLILQRRRRKAPVAAPPTPAPSAPLKRVFWLVLVLLLVTSLSGPLWLPYTGVHLPALTLVITSIVSCILAVGVFLFAWRCWRPRL